MSYMDQMRRVANRYISKRDGAPVTAREIAAWAIDNGQWAPARSQLVSQCADLIARAMREEYFRDPQGRNVRAKHSLTQKRAGKQLHLWIDMRNPSTTRGQMELSAQQRRQQIVGDCLQLKADLDSYNDNYNKGEPIQLVLDFADDVAEAEAARSVA